MEMKCKTHNKLIKEMMSFEFDDNAPYRNEVIRYNALVDKLNATKPRMDVAYVKLIIPNV